MDVFVIQNTKDFIVMFFYSALIDCYCNFCCCVKLIFQRIMLEIVFYSSFKTIILEIYLDCYGHPVVSHT